MNPVQYELFESNDEFSLLKRELDNLKKRHDAVRKAQFGKLHDLSKIYIALKEEVHELRSLMITRKK